MRPALALLSDGWALAGRSRALPRGLAGEPALGEGRTRRSPAWAPGLGARCAAWPANSNTESELASPCRCSSKRHVPNLDLLLLNRLPSFQLADPL